MWIFQSNIGYAVGAGKDKAAAAVQKKTEAEMKDAQKTIAFRLGIARKFGSEIAAYQKQLGGQDEGVAWLKKNIQPKVEKSCDKIEAAAEKAKTLPEINNLLKDATWLAQYVGDKNWVDIHASAHTSALSFAQVVFDKYLPKEKEGFMK
jgi:hypothetical protein